MWGPQNIFMYDVVKGVGFNGNGLRPFHGVQGHVGDLRGLCKHAGSFKQLLYTWIIDG